MKVWKLFFIYTRGKEKNPFFHFSGFPDFPKILKKEYNIRFKIYPSPFTSSPQHISIIVFPTFVFLFTELSHVVQERARSFCPLPLLYPSASDFQFHSAGDRWFRACGQNLRKFCEIHSDISWREQHMGRHFLRNLRTQLIAVQNLYIHFPMNTEISSRRVLMHGAPIRAIKTVMTVLWTCLPSPAHFPSLRMSYQHTSTSIWKPYSE